MRWIEWLLVFATACLGCGQAGEAPPPRQTEVLADAPGATMDDAPDGAESGEAEEAITEETVADTGSTFSGRPLEHWIEQANRAGGPKDPRATVAALVEALSHDDPAVRVAAGDGLAAMGPAAADAVPALVAQLGHPVAWIRVAAMDALGAVGAAAVPALVGTFTDPDPSVGVRSSLVLRGMGPGAVAAIEEAMKDLPGEPRRLVEAVIEGIREDAAAAAKTAGTATAEGLSAAVAAPRAESKDWPQFHGPNRDGFCGDTGLLARWPAQGPKLLWKLEGLGRGYSTVAIADGRLLTMGDRPSDGGESQFVIAYDLATQRELWATRVGPPHEDGGPRSTPTIDGELLYAIGTEGDLLCLEALSGAVRWQKNFVADFQGQMMSGWKFSESPLVDGDRLISTPGGKEATMIALDKRTGELLWKCAVPELGEQNCGAGYSSAVVGPIAGRRQIVQIFGQGLFGVDAATGAFLWGYNRIASNVANITAPILRGDYVFASNAYNIGSALVRIVPDGDGCKAEEVYFTRDLQNHHGGVVLVGDHVYGGHGGNRGQPVCLELATGNVAWKADAPAKGSAGVLYADGQLIFRYDRGPVALVEASPEEFRLKGVFTPPTAAGPAWAHPVIHDGKLYLRHGDLLLCYGLRVEG